MAQKTLRAQVVIGGQVDNTFGTIGTALINMGSQIDEISQKLIDFGKESLGVYRNYEDNMLAAEGALATKYGKDTLALKNVMKDLDAAAKHWASTTIFHTNDVSNAILEAARAGWDLEEIMDAIPNAMELAQAGGLDLSQALDYIITSSKAARVPFEDLGDFIDKWAFAANSSAGTIEEFGEAMQRMGSTMQFAGSQDEILTFLAVLHNNGTKGAAAGTLLRNSFIRLIAPTKKARDAMDELELSEEDWSEAVGETGGDLEAAAASLEKVGFSAYDSEGNLKGFVEIFGDLNKALDGMREEEKNNVLSAIFPTRTITGALNILNAATDGFEGLYEALEAGDAAGYGQYLSELMMSGLTGSVETFQSKVENLELVIGNQLAPQIQTIAENFGKVIDLLASGGEADNGVSSGLDMMVSLSEALGGIADSLGKMDPAVFDGIVAGLGTLAVSGPGLMTAGFAFKLLGWGLGTWPGRVALAALAITALAEGVSAFKEANYQEAFGDMELDTTALTETLNTIHTDFEEATSGVNAFRTALDKSVESYNTASQTFSSTALSDMLTGKQLTEKDIEAYKKLGTDMVGYVKQGITESTDMSAEFWSALFQGQNGTDEEAAANPIFQGIIDALNSEKTQSLAEAEAIGQELEKALTEAFADGQISKEEYENIKSYFRDLNQKMVEAQREAQSEEDFVRRKQLQDKMQDMSWKSAMDFLGSELGPQRQEELDWWQENFGGNKYRLQYRYDQEMAKAKTEQERLKIQETYEPLIQGAEEAYAQKVNEIYANYDSIIMDTMDTLVHESDYGDAARNMEGLMDELLAGTMTEDMFRFMYSVSGAGKYKDQLGRFYADEIEQMGGVYAVAERADYYRANGDLRSANWMDRLLNLLAWSGRVPNEALDMSYGEYGEMQEFLKNRTFQYQDVTSMSPANILSQLRMIESTGEGSALQYLVSTEDEVLKLLSETYDLGAVHENQYEAILRLMNMTAEQSSQYLRPTGEGAAEAASAAYGDIQGALEEMGDLEAGVTITGAAEAAALSHMDMQGYADANPVRFHAQLENGITELTGPSLPGKAKGGRETRPSIFAEAGIPEWYIPEEHTDNTARLLLAAAYGSGFDIFDLAERAGARLFADGGTSGDYAGAALSWPTLNAGAGGIDTAGTTDGGDSGIQVVYSPVIHADNSEGMEQALMEDKRRMQKWFEEWWQKRKLYESVAAYK